MCAAMTRILLLGKALLSVLLAGPLLAVADETEFIVARCPPNNPKDEITNIAHEYDCSKYYACLGDERRLGECPLLGGNRLLFNPKLGVCDWTENVDCEQPRIALTTLRKILPVPTKCPKKESMNYTVHLAHESDCTKFYKCAYGKKVPQNCPCDNDGMRLYFNKYEQVCDWRFNVDCESKDPSTETPCPPPNGSSSPDPGTTPKANPGPSTDPTTPKIDTLGCREMCPNDDPPNHITPLPHEDCRKWCRCQNSEVRVFTCPADFHFSPKLGVCTTPETADCI